MDGLSPSPFTFLHYIPPRRRNQRNHLRGKWERRWGFVFLQRTLLGGEGKLMARGRRRMMGPSIHRGTATEVRVLSPPWASAHLAGAPRPKEFCKQNNPQRPSSALPALNCLHVTVKRPNCLIRFRSRKAYLALLVLFEWIKNCFGIFCFCSCRIYKDTIKRT